MAIGVADFQNGSPSEWRAVTLLLTKFGVTRVVVCLLLHCSKWSRHMKGMTLKDYNDRIDAVSWTDGAVVMVGLSCGIIRDVLDQTILLPMEST